MPKFEDYLAATLPALVGDLVLLAQPDGLGGFITKKMTVSDLMASGATTVGSPNARTLSLATAYQATDNTKSAIVTVNITSTANFSLTGGTTNSADIVIGATTAVASGTGTVIGKYSNSVTGTIAVGLNMNSAAASPISFILPAGWYFAIRQTAGTVTITSAFDQAIS